MLELSRTADNLQIRQRWGTLSKALEKVKTGTVSLKVAIHAKKNCVLMWIIFPTNQSVSNFPDCWKIWHNILLAIMRLFLNILELMVSIPADVDILRLLMSNRFHICSVKFGKGWNSPPEWKQMKKKSWIWWDTVLGIGMLSVPVKLSCLCVGQSALIFMLMNIIH